MKKGQMALDLSLRDNVSFESFVVGHNKELLHHLTSIAEASEVMPILSVWGETGGGKTHLLNSCYKLAVENDLSPWFVSLSDVASVPGSESMVTDIDDYQVFLVDDLDEIAGSRPWEEKLFQLSNHVRDNGKTLVVASNNPPSCLGLVVRDLLTRLLSGLTYQVLPLAEDQKVCALRERANERGFEVSDDTAAYILNHYRRDMGNLFSILDRIDRASLEQKRLITIPFLRSLDLD
jgi:DnaA family protein